MVSPRRPTYYLIGSVINICTMMATLYLIFVRREELKSEVEDRYDLERKWNKMSADQAKGPNATRESYAEGRQRREQEKVKPDRPKNLVEAAEEHTFDDEADEEEDDELGETEVML